MQKDITNILQSPRSKYYAPHEIQCNNRFKGTKARDSFMIPTQFRSPALKTVVDLLRLSSFE